MKRFFTIIILLIATLQSNGQYYNGLQSDFGKNRIQNTEYRWSFYKYEQFNIYFYEEGKNLGDYTAISAHIQIKEFERLFEFKMKSKIDFIVYNTQTQSRESNIGNFPEEMGNIGGAAKTIGTKVFLYYNGNHKDLDIQIRTGVAKIILQELMYGDNYKDVIKNSALFVMPAWFETGLISFLSNNWDFNIENKVKSSVLGGKFTQFNSLKGEDAVIAGHSMWYYIADNYGEGVIPNILFMAKANRNIENGFMFVIGKSLDSFTKDWLFYYENKFKSDNIGKSSPGGNLLLKKTKKTRKYQRVQISSSGKYIAYVTNEYSQQKIWIHNLETGKKKRIFKLGHRLDITPDLTFPVLTWHPSSDLLSFFYEKKGEIFWIIYDVNKKEKIENKIFHFEKILDARYSSNGKKFAFSAVKNGKTDIYVYDIQSRTHDPVTDDFYDDRNPVFINGTKNIIFSSNRTNDTLGVGGIENKVYQKSTDLFQFDYSRKKTNRFEPQVLRRITKTPFINESMPIPIQGKSILFLSDENGIRNQFLAEFDSSVAFVDTAIHYRYNTKIKTLSNYNTSILSHDVQKDKHAQIYLEKGAFKVVHKKLILGTEEKLTPTSFRQQIDMLDTLPKSKPKEVKYLTVDSIRKRMLLDSSYVNINYYIFQDELKNPGDDKTVFENGDKLKSNFSPFIYKQLPTSDSAAKPAKLRNYELAFKTNKVGLSIDNRFMNPSYQRYGTSSGFPNLGMNGFLKYGIIDLMEDYNVTGGYRIGDFYSNEVFLSFKDKKNKIDKQYIFYRGTHLDLNTGSFERNVAYEAITRLSYPFSMVDRIEATFAMRYDNFIPLSVNKEKLQEDLRHEYWPNVRLNYVWDNTRNIALNLREGVKAKIFAEYYMQVPQTNQYMVTLGFDWRKYINVYKGLVWANRIGGGTSFGTQRLLYYLGGIDGWLMPQFNNELAPGKLPSNSSYAFQALALNMRGFSRNVRNGPSFTAINSELRWPIIKHFFRRPINSSFLRNFQVIGFGDIGTAWSGPHPFSEENSFNQTTKTFGSQTQPNKIFVTTHKEPIVGGYGIGIRSKLWGYFIRADWAWGIEDGIQKDGEFYLSLNLDF